MQTFRYSRGAPLHHKPPPFECHRPAPDPSVDIHVFRRGVLQGNLEEVWIVNQSYALGCEWSRPGRQYRCPAFPGGPFCGAEVSNIQLFESQKHHTIHKAFLF